MGEGDILLSKDFDIVITNGDIALTESINESFTQNGRLAIHTRKGSNIFHENLGNNLYNDRVKMTDKALVSAYCEDAILSSADEIRSVDEINVINADIKNNNFDVSFVLVESSIDIENNEEDEEETSIDIFDATDDMYEYSD